MANSLQYFPVISLKVSGYAFMLTIWSILAIISGSNLLISFLQKRKKKKWKKNHTIYLKDFGISYFKCDAINDSNKKELSSKDKIYQPPKVRSKI